MAITVALVMVVIVRHDESSLSDRDVPYANAVAAAALNAKGIATDQRGFLLTGDQSFIAEAQQRVGDARTAFAAAAQQASTEMQRDAVRSASIGFDSWMGAVEDEFATYTAGNHKAAIAASLGPERHMRKACEQSLATAQAAGQRSHPLGEQFGQHDILTLADHPHHHPGRCRGSRFGHRVLAVSRHRNPAVQPGDLAQFGIARPLSFGPR